MSFELTPHDAEKRLFNNVGHKPFFTNPEEDMSYALMANVNSASADARLFDSIREDLIGINAKRNLTDSHVQGKDNKVADIYYDFEKTSSGEELQHIMIVDGDRVAIYPPLTGKEKDLPKEIKQVLIKAEMDKLRDKLTEKIPYFEHAMFANTAWNRNKLIDECLKEIHPTAKQGFLLALKEFTDRERAKPTSGHAPVDVKVQLKRENNCLELDTVDIIDRNQKDANGNFKSDRFYH
ncbi:MAG: hypothetical protein K2Y39_27760 [Candidatus Obscuribacterales bacterium]|nr:hypothetical protein [Candidatus Obscuribacterales bacterium]